MTAEGWRFPANKGPKYPQDKVSNLAHQSFLGQRGMNTIPRIACMLTISVFFNNSSVRTEAAFWKYSHDPRT